MVVFSNRYNRLVLPCVALFRLDVLLSDVPTVVFTVGHLYSKNYICVSAANDILAPAPPL